MDNRIIVANRHGHTVNEITPENVVNYIERTLQANSIIARRTQLARQASESFEGRRDLYESVGYRPELYPNDYRGRFERGDIAQRVVRAKPAETWRNPPSIMDGTTKEDATEESAFVRDWNDVVNIGQATDELLADSKTIWHYCKRVDTLAGLGEFAVMVVGVGDNAQLYQPLKRGAGRQLLYLSTFGQDKVDIPPSAFDTDPTSPRFGLPSYYQIKMGPDHDARTSNVHWTRVVHVADGLLDNDIYGTPRLRAVWNRLSDIEKALAASGEAAWRMATRKIIVSTKDGYTLGEVDATGSSTTSQQLDEVLHDLRDTLALEGYDVTVIDGQMTDPSALVETNIDIVSATAEIPQRILLGSERGELASSQDRGNWFDSISTRQSEYAEPIILRPLIGRLVYAGVVTAPTSGVFIDWPSLYEPDATEQAEVASKNAATVRMLADEKVERIIKPDEFVKEFIPSLPKDAVVDEATREKMRGEAMERQREIMAQRPNNFGNQQRDDNDGNNEPVANSYRPEEQAAMLQAAARVLSGSQ